MLTEINQILVQNKENHIMNMTIDFLGGCFIAQDRRKLTE